MLSAIIAAVVAKKKIRKSPFENEVRRDVWARRARALVSEFNCLRSSLASMSMRIVARTGNYSYFFGFTRIDRPRYGASANSRTKPFAKS